MRSTRPASGGSTKNVSCIWRAGWSGPKLSASKLNHSASISGPSATSQPWPTKWSAICSCSSWSGCRAPCGVRCAGSVTSMASSTSTCCSRSSSSCACRSARARDTRPRDWPTSLPAVALSALSRPPIARLASASGERSPVCAILTALRASRSAAAPMALSAESTAADTAASSRGSIGVGSTAVDSDIVLLSWWWADPHAWDRGATAGAALSLTPVRAPEGAGQACSVRADS